MRSASSALRASAGAASLGLAPAVLAGFAVAPTGAAEGWAAPGAPSPAITATTRLTWTVCPAGNLDFTQHAAGRRGNFGIHLVGRDLKQRLIARDFVAHVLQPARDGAFKDGFSHLRHDNIGGRAGRQRRRWRRRSQAGCAQPGAGAAARCGSAVLRNATVAAPESSITATTEFTCTVAPACALISLRTPLQAREFRHRLYRWKFQIAADRAPLAHRAV